MKIIITGGLGYLGGRLADLLIKNNHDIILLTRQKKVNSKLKGKAKIILVDWNSLQKIESNFKNVDCIIHAASMNATDCEKDPIFAEKFNTEATESLIQLSIKHGIKKFIYISTAHVYSNFLKGEISEDSPTLNTHPYALTKQKAEAHVLNYSSKKLINGLVLRLSNAFGPPVDINTNCWSLVLNDVAKQLVTNNKSIINSSGRQRRDFITMTDACRAILHLLHKDDLKYFIYNIGGEWSPQIKEIIIILVKRYEFLFNIKPDMIFLDSIIENFAPLKYNIERLKLTGFKPQSDKYSITQEIDNLLKFIKHNI